MSSRGLAGVFALLSWAAPVLLPFATFLPADGHGCNEEVCRCAHRPPAEPSPKPCHGADAAPADCRMTAACNHARSLMLVTAPLYEMPALAAAPTLPADPQPLAPAEATVVRHGFARLEPHPPPAL